MDRIPSIVQVNFRMPVDLKERIEAASRRNNRSVTSEIVASLEAAYPPLHFDRIAVMSMVQAYRNADHVDEKIRIVDALQAFLKAFGGNVGVYIDEDDEIVLKGGKL